MSARTGRIRAQSPSLSSFVLLIAAACDPGGSRGEGEPAGSALLADGERLVWKRSLFPVEQLFVLERGGGPAWQPFAGLGALRFGAAIPTTSGASCVVLTANNASPAEHVLYALRKAGPRSEQLLRLHDAPLVEPFAWRVLGDEVAWIDHSGLHIADARLGARATRVFVPGDFAAVHTGPWNAGWLQAGHLVCATRAADRLAGLFTVDVATGAVQHLSTAADVRPFRSRSAELPWLVWLELDGPGATPRCVAADVVTGASTTIDLFGANAPTEAIWVNGRVWARSATTSGDEDLLVADLTMPAPVFRNTTLRVGRGAIDDWFSDDSGERAVCSAGTELLAASLTGAPIRLDTPAAPAASSVHSARWLGSGHVLFVREGTGFAGAAVADAAVAGSEKALWPDRRSQIAWCDAPSATPPENRVRRCETALASTLAPRELFALSVAGGEPQVRSVTTALAPSFGTPVVPGFGERLVYRCDDTLVAVDPFAPIALAISGPGAAAFASPVAGDATVLFLRGGALFAADARRTAGAPIAEVRLTPTGVEAVDVVGRAGANVMLLARHGERLGLWVASRAADSARLVDHHAFLATVHLTAY